jgi:hypothetical protein
MIYAKRTWKRDKSVNLMDIKEAARNIVYHGHLGWKDHRKAVREITDRLLKGESFETDLAVISLN